MPRFKSAALIALMTLPLAGAMLGFGLGRQHVLVSPEPPTRATQLSLPPSTVIHPPMICRGGECAEIKPGMPP